MYKIITIIHPLPHHMKMFSSLSIPRLHRKRALCSHICIFSSDVGGVRYSHGEGVEGEGQIANLVTLRGVGMGEGFRM